jgi:hypothetical protein
MARKSKPRRSPPRKQGKAAKTPTLPPAVASSATVATTATRAAAWDQSLKGPPQPLQGVQARGNVAKLEGTVSDPEAVSIVPTIYPQEPSGPITVQNHITINVTSADFHEFEAKMNEVLAELRKSNEIAGEVRDKVVAEMNAGMTILKSPKPDPRVIDLLLIRPLKYLGDKGGGAAIGALATMALGVLLRMMGIG